MSLTHDPEEFITCYDVARMLKFTPQHVRRMAELRVIPGKKYGREWRFKRSDVLRSHEEACKGTKSQDVDPYSMPTETPAVSAPPKRPRGRPVK